MSDQATLSAAKRERGGKGAARAERRDGRIPAVIYGDKKDPLSITLELRQLQKELGKGGFFTTVYEIDVDGTTEKALPRDVQVHPVTDWPMHVDFLRLGKGAKIAVEIGVTFINEDASPGLKAGGALNVVRHEVELLCPATAIPDEIIVDLTGVEVGDSIHISAIELPDGVTPTITDRDFTVATIAAPKVADEAEEGDEEGEAAEGGEEAAAEEGGDEGGED